MNTRIFVFGVILAVSFAAGDAQTHAANAPKPVSAKKFDALAESALKAMKKRAAELNVHGVAMVAYAQGDSIQAWSSKMAVVGRMTDLPTATNKGNNMLGIVYSKAAEMADTLENSGTAKRPPMTGEFGWQGGLVARGKTGHIIVAFSGGKSEDDVEVSRAGLALLKAAL
jgi:hypothetical protein